MSHLVDTHCHVDLYADFAPMIKAVEAAEIYTIAVTNTPSVFQPCVEILAGKKYIKAAVGMHPQLAHQRARELPLVLELLTKTKYVGEIGLDFTTTNSEDRASQIRAFTAITDCCARFGDKILTVHSRRAAQEVVDGLGDKYPGTVILHWYSGSMAVLERAVSYGFYFSVNPAMLNTEKGRKIVSAIPINRLLTESDGPFVEVTGRPADPRDMEAVTAHLAHLYRVTTDQMQGIVFRNFRSILGQQGFVLHQ